MGKVLLGELSCPCDRSCFKLHLVEYMCGSLEQAQCSPFEWFEAMHMIISLAV